MLINKKQPTVSVCMITYNHEAFISQAIEGVLKQRTNFPIKLVIGEDNSTDNTRAICEEFASNYPDIIELLPKNACNVGMSLNFMNTLKSCSGKYIAICEGDDYWIDNKKLQKQVDFLESNKNYTLCSHLYNYRSIYGQITTDTYFGKVHPNKEGLSFNYISHQKYWLAKTLTILFVNDRSIINKLERYSYTRDEHLIYHLLQKGNGYCMSFIGGSYRKHSSGLHSTLDKLQKSKIHLIVNQELSKYNPNDYNLLKSLKACRRNYINNIIYNLIREDGKFKSLGNNLFILSLSKEPWYSAITALKIIYRKLIR